MKASTSQTDRNRIELAGALDLAYDGLVALDRRMVAAGFSRDWLPPRRHVIDMFAEAHRLRLALRETGALPDLAALPRDRTTVAAAPKAPGPVDFLGPHFTPAHTGDDDRGASLLADSAMGPSSATVTTHSARSTEADPHRSGGQVARTGAYTKPQGHERIVVHLDVQMRTDAKSATAHEQGSASDAGVPISDNGS